MPASIKIMHENYASIVYNLGSILLQPKAANLRSANHHAHTAMIRSQEQSDKFDTPYLLRL
jgi:hypothetical protein